MTDDRDCEPLEDLFRREGRTFLQYVRESFPWAETDDQEAKEGTKDIKLQIDNIGTKASGAILGRYIRMERGRLEGVRRPAIDIRRAEDRAHVLAALNKRVEDAFAKSSLAD